MDKLTEEEFIALEIEKMKQRGTWQVLGQSSKDWIIECLEKKYSDYCNKWIADHREDKTL